MTPDPERNPESSGDGADDVARALHRRLKQSSRLALASDAAGRCVAFDFAAPEQFAVLTDDARILVNCFSAATPTEVGAAVSAFIRHRASDASPAAVRNAVCLVGELVRLAVLQEPDADPPVRYAEAMSEAYVHARPVPMAVIDAVVDAAALTPTTRVLDVGTGVGGISIPLARISKHVLGIDISPPSLRLARWLAAAQGRDVEFRQCCATKLVFGDERFDLVVAGQMLHWVEPVWAMRGIVRSLTDNGLFVAVESKPLLDAQHPFRRLLDFGGGTSESIIAECHSHARRYLLWLRLAQRQPIGLERVRIFRQRRPFDMSFARAFFFEDALRHRLQKVEDPWNELDAQLTAIAPEQWFGCHYWLVACYRKNAPVDADPQGVPIEEAAFEDGPPVAAQLIGR
jgi:SAM-dependent methyltransferase